MVKSNSVVGVANISHKSVPKLKLAKPNVTYISHIHSSSQNSTRTINCCGLNSWWTSREIAIPYPQNYLHPYLFPISSSVLVTKSNKSQDQWITLSTQSQFFPFWTVCMCTVKDNVPGCVVWLTNAERLNLDYSIVMATKHAEDAAGEVLAGKP